MIKIDKSNHVFKMSISNAPAQYCHSGDTLKFETLDCFSNVLIPEGTEFEVDLLKNTNPATGPLYIYDCQIGDTLKIEILDIEVGDVGIFVTGPVNALFENYFEKFTINRIKVQNGVATLPRNMDVPTRPMIGVIGVATEGALSTGLPGIHGGNLDCNDICKGSTLYLPVFTEGGLLAIGDLHALMGDGEIGECGLEIGGMVTIRVTVLKGKHIAAPILETEDFIEIIGLGSTLEEASQNASKHMLDYMIHELNMSENDAAVRVCLCGNLKICQHVNSVKTVAMKIDKSMIT